MLVIVASSCSYSPPASTDDDDDALPDAAVFDPMACPAIYETIGTLTSRYRIADAFGAGGIGREWGEAADACATDAGDGPATHLVVFETAAERTTVWDTVAPRTNFQWMWTGTFETNGGFSTIFGEEVAVPAWAPGEPRSRPGGGGAALAHGHPDNNSEDGDLLVPRAYRLDFVCECDGKPAIDGP